MQADIKKEVSCKAFDPIFYYAKENNIDLNYLIDGTGSDLSTLLDRSERVGWNIYCKIIDNARKYFSSAQFEEMGTSFVKRGNYFTGVLWAFFIFTSNKFIRLIYKKILKFTASYFTCVNLDVEFLAPNKIRQIGSIQKGYEFCPELLLISKGIWQQLGIQIGQREFRIDMKMYEDKIIFDISWEKENLLFKVKKGLRWLFNIRKALIEITDSHNELMDQYQKLENSQYILQKQTTQLKTAHEISTSIRQSPNIDDTLKAITKALVNEAGFTSAFIQLEKGFDDNEIKIEFRSGETTESAKTMYRKLIIDEKEIGKLEVQPNKEKDIREINELLDYLMPVINIAIHDAMTLREVTNYKDNLERMVAERTFELQKARDELSDKNKLLNDAQQAQNRFFTNISHEFRTPLTLILSPAKRIINSSKDSESRVDADFIYRSAGKLNRLVDELLDISKIESGEMKLKVSSVNLVATVKEIALSFSSLVERKKITFQINSDEDEILLYIDKNKFDKILSNVLSNAFKFTPIGGKVEISIKKIENSAVISVADTGIGIPADQVDKIFDRFYQVDGSHTREHGGTGIGLALTKELVELHKGKIEVESEEGKGSSFRIFFPLGKGHFRPEEIFEEETGETEVKIENTIFSNVEEFVENNKEQLLEDKLSLKPALLIVEDNSDVRKYVAAILEDKYKIIEAKDGNEGFDKAIECIPDLIVSDIMMPKMDGFQLCSKLKTDSRTSHIPVVLLTAKATTEDRISGFETGADMYINKPFEAEELKARIKNLLQQRKRLHEHFRQFGLVELDKNKITSVDMKFLQKAVTVIDEHLSDTSFSVEHMADDMAVSRSLLLKKLEALTGQSPVELIRRTRLNKAAILLESNYGNISEVALEVGFNNPSYFSDCFKKQFNVTPFQYQNKSGNS